MQASFLTKAVPYVKIRDNSRTKKVKLSKMAPKKGSKRAPGAGRRAGVPNKQTTVVKEAILEAFELIGGTEAFAKWCKANPNFFYKDIWPKVMPVQVHNTGPAMPTIMWPLAPSPLDE